MAEAKYALAKQAEAEAGNNISFSTSSSVKRQFTGLEKKFVALAVVLGVCTLVFIILFAVCASQTKPTPKERFLNNKAAVLAAAAAVIYVTNGHFSRLLEDLVRSLDTSVSPCEDFYQFSCGQWVKRQTETVTVTQFSKLSNQVDATVGRILNSSDSRREYAEHDAASKMLAYYDSCMDVDEIEERKGDPLLELIKKYGSCPATDSSWNESSWEFLPNQKRMVKELGLSTMFYFYVGQDLKNSSNNVIYVRRRGTGLARRRYFQNTTRHLEIRKGYKRIISKAIQLLGASKNQSVAVADEIYEFEKQLFNISTKLEKGESNLKLLKKMTIKEFTSLTNVTIDWKEYLTDLFSDANLQVTDDYQIHVVDPVYFSNMSRLLENTPKRVLANHLIWHMTFAFGSYLSSEFRKAELEYVRIFYDKKVEPRWKDCVIEVDNTFGMVLALVFVQEVLQKDGKQEAMDLVDSIRVEFEESFDDVEWMDKNTTEAAKKKTRVMAEDVGYPEYITNKTHINQKYKELKINRSTYFENRLAEVHIAVKNKRKQLTKPVDKKEWGTMPQTINAFYWPPDNKIVVPAGILQPPFFSSGRPRSMNYGSIGMIIGHEISHGFDTQGRLFNWNGNMVKWWTAASISAYNNKTKCFIKQYSNITVDGHKVDGKVTLSENMADNSGLKQSYKAYKESVKRLGEELELPGNFGYTHDQLFFLSFAQTFCAKYPPKSLKSKLQSGPHSPGRGRVVGTVSNMPEFAEAFNCPIGSPMNPAHKCSMW